MPIRNAYLGKNVPIKLSHLWHDPDEINNFTPSGHFYQPGWVTAYTPTESVFLV